MAYATNQFFDRYRLVVNLNLGKNQEKKSRKIRGSRDIQVLPRALFSEKFFFRFFKKP
jgi:hypothetical protein